MSTDTEPGAALASGALPRLVRFGTHLFFGNEETISGAVYGTIIILAVIAAEARGYEHHMWQLGVVAFTTAVVLWLAHVYSDALGESVRRGRRLSLAEVGGIARRDHAIVLAAVPPVLAIIAGSSGLMNEHWAYRLATALGITALVVQGIRYATLDRLGLVGTAVAIALNLLFSLLIVLAEVWVAH